MLNADRESLSQNIYFTGLILLAAALPLSMFMMSVSQFVLVGGWLVGGGYQGKILKFWRNKCALVFSLIFAVRLVGMIYTVDFAYGLHDLKISLPLIVLPFIMSGMQPLSKKKFIAVLWFFVSAVTAGVIINSLMYSGMLDAPEGYRGSVFISHIRFSLMICMAIFILGYFIINRNDGLFAKGLMIMWLICLVAFLFILKSVTGVVILVACLITSLVFFALTARTKRLRIALWLLAILIPSIPAAYVYSSVREFYDIKEDSTHLDVYSAYGEKYEHNLDDKQLEEGYYIWRYIAGKELEENWNKRSSVLYDGKDKSGKPLYSTLIRFLTSRGLRKDADGVSKLSPAEVEAVENGIANIRLMDGLSLDDRVYEIIWESHNYFNGVNPQGHSVSQRFEFWKTGMEIFKAHPLIGVGTGGAREAFKKQYEVSQSRLSEEYRLRAHNQYLTTMISFGSIGMILFIIAMLYPFFKERRWTDFLYLIFIVITLLSMINEDTLETQAGVTFVAFFNSLLLFAVFIKPKKFSTFSN